MTRRVAALERENVALREPGDQPDGQPSSQPQPGGGPATNVLPADEPAHGGGTVARDDRGRRLTPPAAPHAAVPHHDRAADANPAAPRHGDDQHPRDPIQT
jgi:hypothetical protein